MFAESNQVKMSIDSWPSTPVGRVLRKGSVMEIQCRVVIVFLATEPTGLNEIARENKKVWRLRRSLWGR